MNKNAESVIERTEDVLNKTRERVKNRAEQLQDELSPSALLEQMIPEGQSASETIRQVGDAARSNPIGSALIAGGAMLLARELLGRREQDTRKPRPDSETVAERVGERVDELRSGAAETVGDLKKMARSAGDTVEENISTARSKISEAASTSEEVVGRAYETTKNQIAQGSREAAKLAGNGKQWVAKNPVAVGLACAAAGALVASYFVARPLNRKDENSANDGVGSDKSDSSGKKRQTKTRAANTTTQKKQTRKKPAKKKTSARGKANTSRASNRKTTTAKSAKPKVSAKPAAQKSTSPESS